MASSWVWNHFTDSGNRDKAQCKHCNKLLTCAGHSTSALARHLESQHQIFKLNPGRSSSLERHFQAVSSEQQLNRLHNKILRLIVEDMSPFQWTESKAFHDLWAEFAGSTPPPSAKVVKRLLEERYNDVLVKVCSVVRR
jgi:pyrroline-5-carboxylate reductase